MRQGARLARITAQNKSRPKAALAIHGGEGLRGVERHLVLPPIRHEADASEAKDHHRPC